MERCHPKASESERWARKFFVIWGKRESTCMTGMREITTYGAFERILADLVVRELVPQLPVRQELEPRQEDSDVPECREALRQTLAKAKQLKKAGVRGC